MTTINKKLSDFQNNECDTIERVKKEDTQKECPKCEKNPNFKLPKLWFDLPDPYLNEKFCEYHVRVYTADAVKNKQIMTEESVALNEITPSDIIDTAINKFIKHFKKKPSNDNREIAKKNTKIIKNLSIPRFSAPQADENLGRVHLVVIPAMSFNALENLPEDEKEENQPLNKDVKEIKIKVNGFLQKHIQIMGALRIYGAVYASLSGNDKSEFFIYQEDNPTQRLNFQNKIDQFLNFRGVLNDALADANISRIGVPPIIQKAITDIKFIFDKSDPGYKLKRVLVLEEKCPDKYRPIAAPELIGKKFQFSFAILDRLDEVIKEITSPETKPWLEFVTEYFYPPMAIEYGNLNTFSEETKNSLGCLADKYFGAGKLANTHGEILNGVFDDMIKQAYESACRSINEVSVGGPEARAQSNRRVGKQNRSLKQEKLREKNKYINFVLDQVFERNTLHKAYGVFPCRSVGIPTPPEVESQPPAAEPQPPVAETPAAPEPNVEPPSVPRPDQYIVKKGDTMYGIAKKYNLSIRDLLALNPQFNADKLSHWSSKEGTQYYGRPSGETASKPSDRNPNWIFPNEPLNVKKPPAEEPPKVEVPPIEDILPESQFAYEFPDPFGEPNENLNDFPGATDSFLDSQYYNIPAADQGIGEDLNSLPNPTPSNSPPKVSQSEITFSQYITDLGDVAEDKCITFNVLSLSGGRTEQKIIANYKVLEQLAKDYAEALFRGQQRDWGFGKDGEITKAWDAVIDNDNTFLGAIKGYESIGGPGGNKFNFWAELINIIGLCGMSNLADQALKCLLGGMTINQFYDLMIDKFFEFIDFSLFDLFLNELPYSFRQDLDKKIQEEFGEGVSITDMINIKKQSEQKLGEVVNFKIINQLEYIFKTYNSINDLDEDQKTLVFNNLGDAWATVYIGLDKTGEKQQPAIKNELKKQRRTYLKNRGTFQDPKKSFIKSFNIMNIPGLSGADEEQELLEEERDVYERMNEVMESSNIGEGFDAVFDVILGFTVDYIIELISVDALIEIISDFPGGEFIVGFVGDFYKSCPHPGIFKPPARDFLKTFTLDVCDPEIGLYIPRLIIPNINLRYQLHKAFGNAFANAIEQLFIKIIVDLIQRLAGFLQDLLCKTLEALGTSYLGTNALKGLPNPDSLREAIDEAFCGGATNPETGKPRSQELIDSLIEGKKNGLTNRDLQGAGATATNIISGVAGAEEILEAMIEGNDGLNAAIANAVQVLSPELVSILGTPSLVGFFFENLGSFLSQEDKDRIREMLDRGVPNIPLTASICLTDDQLDAWNQLREDLLRRQGLQPGSAINPAGFSVDPEDFGPGGSLPEDLNDVIEDDVDNMNSEVEEALSDVLDDVFELNSDGPFLGALSNELMKDLCNPENKFNLNSKSEFDKEEDDDFRDEEFQNTKNIFAYSMYGRNGLFGHALRDTDHNHEIKRKFHKLVNPNYTNSFAEHAIKLADAGFFEKSAMAVLPDNTGSLGAYPATVATRLLDYEFDPNNITSYITMTFTQEEESEYRNVLSIYNLTGSDGVFGYTIYKDDYAEEEILDQYSFDIKISIDDVQKDFISSYGTEFSNGTPARQHLFQKYMESKIPIDKDYSEFYKDISIDFANKMLDACFTDDREDDLLSDGFRFGYIEDTLGEDDYVYSGGDDDTETLGTYANDRVVPLNPEIYGGRYSNPRFTVKTRDFKGWLGYAMHAFDIVDGCQPTSPPIINMENIKNRVKKREEQLRDYSDLARDIDCTSEKPFKLLTSKEFRADIGGVVETTLKSYVSEYFFKATPIFSNIEYSHKNYGAAFTNFIVLQMKEEMSALGPVIPTRQLQVAKTRYWYAFLEQVVQAYNEKVKAKEITPSNRITEILSKISEMQMQYKGVTSKIKYRMIAKQKENTSVKHLSEKPSHDEILNMLSKKPARFGLLSLVRRLIKNDDKFYNSEESTTIEVDDVRLASLKKMQFFAKMFAIELYEEECTEILTEMISSELEELSKNAYYPKRLTTNIFDVMVGLTSITNIFPDTQSLVGRTDFYNEFTSRGVYDPGDVPDYVQDKQYDGDGFKFIVEKYISLTPKEGMPLPEGLESRMSIEDFRIYISQLSSEESEKSFSDYFGDLEFTYETKILSLLNAGFSSQLLSLELGQSEQVTPEYIDSCIRAFNLGEDLPSNEFIIHKSNLIPEGQNPTPIGVTGETGVNYGLSIGLICETRKIFDNEEEGQLLELMNTDGSIFITLTEAEYAMSDMKFSDFNPEERESQFDLECLVNKMSQSQEYKMLFELLFPVKMYTSLAALYSCENFMASIGYGENERTAETDPQTASDAWEGTTNLFYKKYLRRQFSSIYLGNTSDGLGGRRRGSRRRLLGGFNPFEYLSKPSYKLPWWTRRKLESRVLDENGEDCADPKKDFR